MLTADPVDAVVDLTRQLVAFDSVNPGLVPGAAGEGPVAQFAADRRGPAAELMNLLAAALPAAGAAPPARAGAPYWMESALWQASGVPAVVCAPAGGGLHAAGEWIDLAQLRRYPVPAAAAAGRFLAR